MKKFKTVGLACAVSLISFNSFASITNGLYVKALGGIALGNASGLSSFEPNEASVVSGIKVNDKSGLFGAALGYAISNSPISLELQALRINHQHFTSSNLYADGYHENDSLSVRSNVLLLNAIYALPLRIT